MSENGEEIQTQGIRSREEERDVLTHRGEREGTRQDGQSVGLVQERISGADRTRPYPPWANTVNGGILYQLIQQTEDRLGEAQACVTWYEDEVGKIRGHLKHLKALAQKLEEDQQSE